MLPMCVENLIKIKAGILLERFSFSVLPVHMGHVSGTATGAGWLVGRDAVALRLQLINSVREQRGAVIK